MNLPAIPAETPLLTDDYVAKLVDEGRDLEARIQMDSERQKQIEKLLKEHALSVPSQHVKLVDEDREGTRYLALGTDGTAVPVVCTSDLISQSIPDDHTNQQLQAVQQFSGAAFPKFYKRVSTFVTCFSKSNKFDGKRFREAARAELADPEAFISACTRRNSEGIPVSAIKVEWS